MSWKMPHLPILLTTAAICLPKTVIPRSKFSQKIDSAYQQLFHGDPQAQAIAFAAGCNANGLLIHITGWANHDVRTEDMSCGMLYLMRLLHVSGEFRIWMRKQE
ncbi:MAG: hypothetical protein ABUS47_11215 [Steroidobacter sp.]